MSVILWCEVHGTANRPNTLGCWIGYDLWEDSRQRNDPLCSLVPMRLIPDNGETVERVQMVIAAWAPDLNRHRNHEFALELIANLDEETP